MVTSIRRAAANVVENYWLDGFELPADFLMLTAEEIEQDLELGKPGWQGLLRSSESDAKQATGRFPRVLILVAVVALSAVFWGAVSVASGPVSGGAGTVQTISQHFIWTARGPIPADGLINSVTAVATLNDATRP